MQNINSLIKEEEKGVKCLKSPRLPRHKTRKLAAETQAVSLAQNKGINRGRRDLVSDMETQGLEGHDLHFLNRPMKWEHSLMTDSTGT